MTQVLFSVLLAAVFAAPHIRPRFASTLSAGCLIFACLSALGFGL